MNLLLDSHIFIWYVKGDERLSAKLLPMLTNADNRLYLSHATLWEFNIKQSKAPLEFLEPDETLKTFIRRERIAHEIISLPVEEDCFYLLPELPLHHKDPFDRILICQAISHGFTLVTADPLINLYDFPHIYER